MKNWRVKQSKLSEVEIVIFFQNRIDKKAKKAAYWLDLQNWQNCFSH